MSRRTFAMVLTVFASVSAFFFSACASGAPDPMNLAIAESRSSLDAGDFQKAIDSVREAWRGNPKSKEGAANFAAVVEELHASGDRALGRKDYFLAERIYRILIGNYADFEPIEEKLRFRKDDLESGLKYCRISRLDGSAVQSLKTGDVAKALDAYPGLLKEYPGDPDLVARYLRTIREVKAAGEKALAGKDFAQAGKAHWILLQRYPEFQAVSRSLPFGKPDLEAALVLCRDGLTKAGLSEYRNGNLAKAIAAWESLLAFDPGNAEIKKAVDTAKTQLKGIEKKK